MADISVTNNSAPLQPAAEPTSSPVQSDPLANVRVTSSPVSMAELQQHIHRLVKSLEAGQGLGRPLDQLPSVQFNPNPQISAQIQFNPAISQTRNDQQFDPQTQTQFRAPANDPVAPARPSPREAPANADKSEKPTPVTEKPAENAWLRSKAEPTSALTPQSKEHTAAGNPDRVTTDGKTEQTIATTKTPLQAIERALDSVFQGAAPDSTRFLAERPASPEARPTVSLSQESPQNTTGTSERGITTLASPSPSTDTATPSVSSHNQTFRLDTGITEAPAHHPNLQVEQKAFPQIEQRVEPRVDQKIEQQPEQRAEQKTEQRSEQLRIIQQIASAEYDSPLTLGKILPTDVSSFARDLAPSIHPRHESTTVAIQTLRDSLLSKLEMIQSQIQTSTTERHHVEHTRSALSSSTLQGRSELRTLDPILHSARHSTDLRLADRSSAPPSIAKMLTDTPRSISNLLAPGASILHQSAQGAEHMRGGPHQTDSLERLINALKKFSRRSTNFELMKRMDSTLEQTCLSLVTAVALGAVGIEVMIRLAHAALAALLKELQERNKNGSGELDTEKEVENELASYLIDAQVNDDTIGSVVDVSGLIVSHDSGEPVAGILLGSRELGSAVSAQDGTFVFQNIPFGISYTLSLYKGLHHVTPNTVNGVSGVASFHRIEATLTATKPR